MDRTTPQPEEASGVAPRPVFSKDQEEAIFRAACQRVAAAVRREPTESTDSVLGETADVPVYGVFVTLKREGHLRACCGYIDLPTPLFKALDVASVRAATDDPRFPPITSGELRHLHVDVWILWGPEPVHERGEDRINAVKIGKHGVQIARGAARGLLLPGVAVEHHFDALKFLQQVCVKAGLPIHAWKDDETQLRVFEGHEIRGNMEVVEADVREPAVAGGFYPGTPGEVQHAVEQLFEGLPTGAPETWAGAMAPHAGWIYSGRLAATVFSRVAIPSRVIIFCPKHRASGANWAVAPHHRWEFPGGGLDSDPELAHRLAAGIDGLELDSDAHRQEHAIEVQLPLLAHVAPQTRVVGVSVGDSSLPELLRFGVAMSVVLRDMPEQPLLVISSDMNHFADETRTRRVDRIALDAIATLDPQAVYEAVRGNHISMCGMPPCVVVMEALRWLGCLKQCETVGYTTSAEASGDVSRVVGYAGLLFR